MRVLAIEDDPNIAEAISFGLERLSLQPLGFKPGPYKLAGNRQTGARWVAR